MHLLYLSIHCLDLSLTLPCHLREFSEALEFPQSPDDHHLAPKAQLRVQSPDLARVKQSSRSENRDLPWGNQLKSIQNIEDTSTNGYNMTQLDSSAASSFQSATGQFLPGCDTFCLERICGPVVGHTQRQFTMLTWCERDLHVMKVTFKVIS